MDRDDVKETTGIPKDHHITTVTLLDTQKEYTVFLKKGNHRYGQISRRLRVDNTNRMLKNLSSGDLVHVHESWTLMRVP
ncbi:MAG: hypothetical protein ACFFD4_29235 [Candidatus Odinarchaeota archaeon]